MIPGIRDDSIRLELDALLRNYTTDEKFLESVTEMVRRQAERNNKYRGKCKVLSVTTEESEVLKELKSLRLEVKELKSTYSKSNQSQTGTENETSVTKKRNRNSCKNCVSLNARCTHCYNCGSSEHYQYRCPENAGGGGESLQNKGAQ